MMNITVTTDYTPEHVRDAIQAVAFESFQHAGASIAKDARASLEQAEGPSAEGQPPHTHKGRRLARSIQYAADKDGVVIGPVASIVGESGAAHEFGGEYKGDQFEERSFMAPALERGAPRFAADWRGRIGE